MKPTFQRSIDSTIEYAKFFDFSLTKAELHHWLISSTAITKSEFSRRFSRLSAKTKTKVLSKLSPARKERKQLTQLKLNSAKKIIKTITSIPTIKLVCVTGSLSMDNAKPHDDIDLMIITHPHTLWFTRALTTLILFLSGKKRPPSSSDHYPDTICINLWLETTTFTVPIKKQNLYTAHEVLQAKPIFDRDHTYQAFLKSNSWVSEFLANAYQDQVSNNRPTSSPQLLLSAVIAPLNFLAYSLQYFYMMRKITREKVSLHSAYFHPRDFSPQVDSFIKT